MAFRDKKEGGARRKNKLKIVFCGIIWNRGLEKINNSIAQNIKITVEVRKLLKTVVRL